MADVRLIDANSLKSKINFAVALVKKMMGGNKLLDEIIGGFIKQIDVEPTIDPESLRPVGRWHLNEDGKWACTYCDGLAVEHLDEPEKWQALTRYCPHCGARMKGEAK